MALSALKSCRGSGVTVGVSKRELKANRICPECGQLTQVRAVNQLKLSARLVQHSLPVAPDHSPRRQRLSTLAQD